MFGACALQIQNYRRSFSKILAPANILNAAYRMPDVECGSKYSSGWCGMYCFRLLACSCILLNSYRRHQFTECSGIHAQIGGQVFMWYQLQYVRTAFQQGPELFFGAVC